MKYKLNEIASITKLAGFEFTKYMKYIPGGEIIAIRALNLKNGTLILNDVRRIAKTVSENLERSKLYKYDIVLSYTGTIGECAQIKENGKYHLAPNVCKITPHTERVNPDFLFQYVRSPLFKQLMLNYCHGSTQPTIPMATIRELPVEIPFDIAEQRKVAGILSAIDDKIELNNQINKNLEQQAQALFKSWFVDFEPFGGVMPDDWTEKSVYDLADYINGASFKKNEYSTDGLPIIKIAELKNGITDSTQYCCVEKDEKYYLDNKDILFSWSGNPETSIDTFLWYRGKAILNQHTFRVVSNYNAPAFTYFLLKYLKPEFTHIASNKQTTGLGHVTVSDLKRLHFFCSIEAIIEFEKTSKPLFEMIYNTYIENNQLAALRDTLLPKLMNGEIDVSEVKI